MSGEMSPMDDHSTAGLVRWLRNQYARHHEIEDKLAAEHIEQLADERMRARGAALRAGFHGGDLAEIIDNLREQLAEARRAGWVLVPREPTEAMVQAGAAGICSDSRGCRDEFDPSDSVWPTWQRDARYAYAAMVSTAMQGGEA